MLFFLLLPNNFNINDKNRGKVKIFHIGGKMIFDEII
jgi:hypothetical protein